MIPFLPSKISQMAGGNTISKEMLRASSRKMGSVGSNKIVKFCVSPSWNLTRNTGHLKALNSPAGRKQV